MCDRSAADDAIGAELELLLAAQQGPGADELRREVFGACSDGIVLTDLDGGFVDANPFFLAMVGVTLEELKTMSWRDLMAPGFYDAAAVLGRLAVDPTTELEMEILARSGGLVPVAQRSWLIRDSEGRPRGLCCRVKARAAATGRDRARR